MLAVALATGTVQQLVASELTPRDVLDAATRVVKIYGAGGLGRIEAYQTGCLISPEGHVLTANSLVLDDGQVTIVTHTGDRYSAVVLGADPIAEVAVVKFDPAGELLGWFDLAAEPAVYSGQRAFALANVFGIASGDEPVSVQRCVVAAVAPLKARRGPLQRIDGDDVLILDAVTSNPGAAGGAVVDREGRLIGMLGRELTSRVTGTWLNYAAPVASLRIPVERIMQGYSSAGSSTTDDLVPTIDLLMQFGFALTPDIVQRTPPYVDYVRDDSPASAAGLLPDDLIITANGLVTSSTAELRRNVARIAGGNLTLLVKRGDEFLEFELAPAEPTEDE